MELKIVLREEFLLVVVLVIKKEMMDVEKGCAKNIKAQQISLSGIMDQKKGATAALIPIFA